MWKRGRRIVQRIRFFDGDTDRGREVESLCRPYIKKEEEKRKKARKIPATGKHGVVNARIPSRGEGRKKVARIGSR